MLSQNQTFFGNTAIGTNLAQNDANAQSVSYFVCSATGSITDIVAYIDGASSGKAIAALYAVNGNSAGALLEQSSSMSIGTSFSWVDFSLSTPFSVSSGLTYGLAIMGNVVLNIGDSPILVNATITLLVPTQMVLLIRLEVYGEPTTDQ